VNVKGKALIVDYQKLLSVFNDLLRCIPQNIIFQSMSTTQQTITPPITPPGRRIYAIGDVHGRLDLLKTLLEMIERDGASNQRGENILVMLGDYIDRGPDSKSVIDLLSMPAPQGFDIVCLKGNHENMLLQFLQNTGNPRVWLKNGGLETLKSYGLDIKTLSVSSTPEAVIEQARTELQAVFPGAHMTFLTALDMVHYEGDYLFVHAGVRPGIPLNEQNEEDLIWIRKEFLQSEEKFEKIVVHGHSISGQPKITNNRIGIDTGAWRSGVLTCLVLEGDERRFLRT